MKMAFSSLIFSLLDFIQNARQPLVERFHGGPHLLFAQILDGCDEPGDVGPLEVLGELLDNGKQSCPLTECGRQIQLPIVLGPPGNP